MSSDFPFRLLHFKMLFWVRRKKREKQKAKDTKLSVSAWFVLHMNAILCVKAEKKCGEILLYEIGNEWFILNKVEMSTD